MATDISRYVQDINNKEKGETVRDAIIGALRVIYGQGVSASMLNGAPLSDFVVHILNESNPATNWNETKLLTKDMVDFINYSLTRAEDPSVVTQTDIGPSGSFSSQDATAGNPGIYSFNRLAKTKKDIRDAINAAWRDTPSGAHAPTEYLVLSQDPFEDYPNFISLIGVGEGYTNSVSTLEVTENGLYTAPAGTGYDQVNVNVQELVIRPLTTEIEADGIYTASNIGADGFSFVTVHVPVIDPSDPSYDPETAYDPEAWSQGGSPETGVTAVFKAKGQRWTQDLEYGETPSFSVASNGMTTADIPKDDDEYFFAWNPTIGPITHNQVYEAIFKHYEYTEVSTGEITDSWETIAGNNGEPYPIGSWKTLDFGKVKRYVGMEFDSENEDYVPTFKEINIGRVIMIKVANANEDDGSTSTWISEMALDLGGLPISNPWSAREIAIRKENGDVLSFGDTDLWDFLNGSRNSVIHNIFENINPFVISKMKTVRKKSLGTKLYVTTNDSTGAKTLYNAAISVSNFPGYEIAEDDCLFWITSNDEMFHKFSSSLSSNYGYYVNSDSSLDGTFALSEATRKTIDCGGPEYTDFFFGRNGVQQSYLDTDWSWYTGVSSRQSNVVVKPYRCGWNTSNMYNSFWMTAALRAQPYSGSSGANYWLNDSGKRIGTRDIANIQSDFVISSENGKLVPQSSFNNTIMTCNIENQEACEDNTTVFCPFLPVRFGWDSSGSSPNFYRYYKYPLIGGGAHHVMRYNKNAWPDLLYDTTYDLDGKMRYLIGWQCTRNVSKTNHSARDYYFYGAGAEGQRNLPIRYFVGFCF